jgi:hypothetical protein
MPAACVAAEGDQIIVTAANAVMPDFVGMLAITTSTQVDDTPVATNSLSLFTVPDPPQSPGAQGGDGSVTISWSAPDSTGGSEVTGYNVYCSTSGTPSTADTPTATTDASTTSTEIDGLTRGTRETCIVTAVNAAGESSATDPVSAAVLGVPHRPVGVDAFGAAAKITVDWQPPLGKGGSRITRYLVYCSATHPVTIEPSNLCATTRGTRHTTTLTGLTNGTTYYIRVAAQNAIGTGKPSAEVSAVPNHPPTRPRALQVMPVAGGLSMTWKPPTNDFGSPIVTYLVVCLATSPPGPPAFTGSSGLQVELDGLDSGTLYSCSVAALNGAGQVSPPSLEATGTPL